MRRPIAALLVATLSTAGGAAVHASPAPDGIDAHGFFDRLSASLRVAALPEAHPSCGVTISRPDGTTATVGCADGDGLAPPADADAADAAPFEFSVASSLQTPGWYAVPAPLNGAGKGAFVRVHGYGDLAATSGDGRTLWTRGAMSFFDEWGLTPWVVPFVFIGTDPLDPRTLASERPFAVADVTDDGLDDVVVAHYVRQRDSAGKTSATSVLTVLDGRDGETLWTRLYPGFVTQVVSSGETIVIGQETGDVAKRPAGYDPNGADGTTTTLRGLGFEISQGSLKGTETWSVETGHGWARWLAAEPMPGGLVAASWMDKAFGAQTGTPGHTILVDAEGGAVRWRHDHATGYPRALRYDASRGAVVVSEMTDPLVPEVEGSEVDYPFRYRLVALTLGGGSPLNTATREDAVLLTLEVADLNGTGPAEWIVGDAAITDHPNDTSPSTGVGVADYIVAGRVAAIDAESGNVLWTRETRCPGDVPFAQTCGATEMPFTYSLHVAGSPPIVVDASLSGGPSRLRGLAGSNGAVLWDRRGDPAFPLDLAPTAGPDGPAVLAVTPSLVQRAYDVSTGETLLSAPIPFELQAVDTVDLDGDGVKELIAGAGSGAVFALDISSPETRIVWSAEVDGPVHEVDVVDLGSDGRREIVAAATSAVVILDLDGNVLVDRSIAYPDAVDYVWTFTTGDVDGDGRTDLVVPTTTLTAYDGRTSEQMWEFAGSNPAVLAYFSEAVVTPDHRVAAQWLTRSGIPFLNARSHQLVTAIDGPTGRVAWSVGLPSKFGIVDLWRSVTIDPDHSCGPGTTIGFTWDDAPTPPVVGWFARTDFYDSQTGLRCYTAGPQPEGIVHMGTVHEPGTGMLEFNWYNVAHLSPDGVTETHFAEENAAVSDVAMADFGPVGRRFLKTWVRIQAFAPTSPTGSDGDNPAELAAWGGLETGRMFVDDVDGDGSDEVVAMPFDWTAYAVVASFSGTGVFSSSFNPHGIAVLEAGPVGGD